MKRIIATILGIMLLLGIYAQYGMFIQQEDGTVTAFAITEVDSIKP